jgi:hypothetical protein
MTNKKALQKEDAMKHTASLAFIAVIIIMFFSQCDHAPPATGSDQFSTAWQLHKATSDLAATEVSQVDFQTNGWAADRRPPHTTQSFGFAQDKTMRALALAGRTAHNYFYPLIEPISMRKNMPPPAHPGPA